VKTTNHLLVVRSDAYELADDWTVRLAPGRDTAPLVELSDEFKLLRDFEARFPAGPPSLVEAKRLEVDGDVHFGRDVRVRGRVRVEGPAEIPDGAVLEG
jgi:UTP--glucose-1-phosphate uridylyltransferase